jgi:hypothetical protein
MCVFTSCSLVTASNNGDYSAFALTPWPAGHRHTTELNFKLVTLITPWHGPRRRHCFPQFLYCCAWTVGDSHVFATQSVQSHADCCLATAVVSLFRGLRLPTSLCAKIFSKSVLIFFMHLPRPSKWPIPLRFSNQKCAWISYYRVYYLHFHHTS